MAEGKTRRAVCALMYLVLFVLFVTAFSAEYWWSYELVAHYHYGLWKFCRNTQCSTITGATGFWAATQAMMILALVCTVTAGVWYIVLLSNTSNAHRLSAAVPKVIAALNIATVVFCVIALVVFGAHIGGSELDWCYWMVIGVVFGYLANTADVLTVKAKTSNSVTEHPPQPQHPTVASSTGQTVAYPVGQTGAYPMGQSLAYPMGKTVAYSMGQTGAYPVGQPVAVAYPGSESTVYTAGGQYAYGPPPDKDPGHMGPGFNPGGESRTDDTLTNTPATAPPEYSSLYENS